MAFFVTAVATAIEVGSLATIAVAVSEVGMALSVVGAVTGNKELMKIGGVMGLAGGVTGLVGGLASTGEAALVDAAVTGTSVGEAASGAEGLGASAAELSGQPTDLPNRAVSSMTTDVGGGAGMPGANSVTYPGAPPDPAAGNIAQQSGIAGAPTAPTPQPASVTPQTTVPTNPTPGAPQVAGGEAAVATPAGTDSSSLSKWFNGLDPKTKGTVLNGLLQTGGQALGGMFQGWSAEQKLALEQNAQNLAEQHYQTAMKNANATTVSAPKPTGLLATAGAK